MGEGEGALFLLPWGKEGGGGGFRGGGGEASFLEVEGSLEGVREEIGILLVLFLSLFLDLTTTLLGLGWKSGSSGSESFSGEEGGGE